MLAFLSAFHDQGKKQERDAMLIPNLVESYMDHKFILVVHDFKSKVFFP